MPGEGDSLRVSWLENRETRSGLRSCRRGRAGRRPMRSGRRQASVHVSQALLEPAVATAVDRHPAQTYRGAPASTDRVDGAATLPGSDFFTPGHKRQPTASRSSRQPNAGSRPRPRDPPLPHICRTGPSHPPAWKSGLSSPSFAPPAMSSTHVLLRDPFLVERRGEPRTRLAPGEWQESVVTTDFRLRGLCRLSSRMTRSTRL